MIGKINTISNKAISFEKMMLENKIAGMEELPTLPLYVVQVINLLKDENVDVHDLVSSIERDQSLVTQILKLINSGYYGLRNTVDTVERAVTLLGIIGIKQVIYSAAIIDFFSEDEQIEWAHSYSSSVLMNNLMKEYKIPVASNLPMTMLMHDVGKIVLKLFSPQKARLAREMSKSKGIPLVDAEDQAIHINHAEVGGIIMEKWGMTDDIIIPIKYHHTERDLPEEYQLETVMVQVVNYIDCTARGIRCNSPKPGLLKMAGISGLDYDQWIIKQKQAILELDNLDVVKK